MPTIDTTVFPTEAYVLVQADWTGLILRDRFGRIAATLWAPGADTGQVYALQSGANGDFTVNGTQGLITYNAANQTKRLRAPLAVLNTDTTGTFLNTVTPAGGDFTLQVMQRFVDLNNFVDVRFMFTAAGATQMVLRQIVGGVTTASAAIPIPGALPTAGFYNYRFYVNGPLIAAKLWLVGTPQPTAWAGSLATTWLTPGDMIIGGVVGAGVTNPTPIIFAFDDLLVVDPNALMSDCLIVTRENLETGEVVQLRPYIAYSPDGGMLVECGQGLWWDTEPPLNVDLEYCTIACDEPHDLTSNPDFEAGTGGWTATGGVLAQNCAISHSGSCSGQLTPSGIDGNPNISQTGIVAVPGFPVTASAWMMSPQGWNSVFVKLEVVYQDFTSDIFTTELVTLDDNEWRYLTLTFTPSQPVISGTFTVSAAGIPPNTTLFYIDEARVTQFLDPTAPAVCETTIVENDDVWLKDPLHPCNDVVIGLCSPMFGGCDEDSRVSYVGTFDDTYDPNTVMLGAANRRRPIPISRMRRDAAATLRLLAHDCDAKDAVLQINEPGTPLLFQAPADYCIPDRYISVGPVTEDRFSVDQRRDFRLMTIPYVVVDRPEGPADGPCGTRIEDLCDIYTSWAALNIADLSWTDLMLGQASPDGPGQPDPPVGARTWDGVEAEFVDWDDELAGGTRDWNELRDGL